ncbi:Spt4/RpoE2 zinc finger-domain-containing protein [Daldinia vernicosa]|uniref:Spt4/RpoE2 zinc finger-domain-containing protein n=1 Tax=Daldinia vernicosa TaxID=114800 RepID=UPI002007AC32|nr:Spt4/RpoE2 zinc finger-domain-containing protein [Daldinia vernicosa]KAI0852409.1 Spt4/RpoE2 zinc finger-domain-containing protein [Daldinia vernicosa]
MASQNLLGMVIAPNQWRYARACMVCSIIMTQSHFRAEGCPNCPFLDLKGSPEAIEACTSSQFEGTAAYFQPRRSWVARWQRVDTFVPGTYAIKVNGSLPEDIKQAMEDQGHTHIPQQAESQPVQSKGKKNAQETGQQGRQKEDRRNQQQQQQHKGHQKQGQQVQRAGEGGGD